MTTRYSLGSSLISDHVPTRWFRFGYCKKVRPELGERDERSLRMCSGPYRVAKRGCASYEPGKTTNTWGDDGADTAQKRLHEL